MEKIHTICKEKEPPRNCLHEIIDNLMVYQNDYRRITTELKNLQEEFKSEMHRLEYPCDELRKILCCKAYDKTEGESFMQRIGQINQVYNCFMNRIEELNGYLRHVLEKGQICMRALCISKESMKKTHERKVEDLKRLAMCSCDEKQIACYEKKICELQKEFAKEVMYVQQAELALNQFCDRVKEEDTQEYIECDTFRGYDWMPKGKSFDSVDKLAGELMSKMGRSLVQAFAQQHIQQPADSKGFLASYLMNLERNQKCLQEKMNLLNAEPEKKMIGCVEAEGKPCQ